MVACVWNRDYIDSLEVGKLGLGLLIQNLKIIPLLYPVCEYLEYSLLVQYLAINVVEQCIYGVLSSG